MNKLTQTILAAGLLALAGTASAVPILGSVAFGVATDASWTPVESDLTTVTTVKLATGVQFNANGAGDDATVTGGKLDYAGLTGTVVDFNDFVFNSLTTGTQLWSFVAGGITYSFAMDTVTFLAQSTSTVALEGTGMASIDGFDDSFGLWTLNLSESFGSFSFSATSGVPEPTIALLLGVGLIGFGFARRTRKSA